MNNQPAQSPPMTRQQIAISRCFLFVWFCAATIAPIGDHYHVAQGVTEYFTEFGPIWFGNSPLWFVLLVASFMALMTVVQGLWAPPRGGHASDWIFASPLLILGLYLLTSFYPWREGGSLEALLTLVAIVSYLKLDRTRFGLGVGVAVAIGASFTEWMLVQVEVFRYLPESDEMFGVAPWLLPLYFTASIVAGAMGRRMLGRPL